MTVHIYCHGCGEAVGMNGPRGRVNDDAVLLTDEMGRTYAECADCIGNCADGCEPEDKADMRAIDETGLCTEHLRDDDGTGHL